MAGLVVVGLGIGIWLLWPWGNEASTTSTSVLAAGTTTTSVAVTTTTTTLPATTTTVEESHVVETVEEAEAILRELWFGWFEGIYNQDEERIREVVATDHQFNLGKNQFGQMSFEGPPGRADLAFADTEILKADDQCLAVWTTTTLSGFSSGNTSDVHILRLTDRGWGIFGLWTFKGDLWEDDCVAQLGS